MSDTDAPASPPPQSPPKSSAPGIQSLLRTTQFIWFSGHVASLTGAVFYALFSLRIFKAPSFPKFWYREAYVAAIFTFGIILKQTYRGRQVSAQALLRDDNVHYLLIAILWLFSPTFFGTLPPFIIFSLFHVLSYTRSFLLPALGYSATAPLSNQIHSFVTTYNDQFMLAAANVEMFLFLRLLALFLTFRKGTTLPFVVFSVFMKLRYDSSSYTRTVFRTWEVRIDNLLHHPAVPAVILNGWVHFKGILRTYLGPSLSAPAPTAAAAH